MPTPCKLSVRLGELCWIVVARAWRRRARDCFGATATSKRKPSQTKATAPMTIHLNGRPVAGFAVGEPQKKVDHFFDRYSVVHAAVGAMLEVAGVPPALSLASHVVFEALENSLKEGVLKTVWPDIRPDGWQNHVGDMTSYTSGLLAARAIKETEGGKAALTGLAGVAGAIWMWNLAQKHSWERG